MIFDSLHGKSRYPGAPGLKKTICSGFTLTDLLFVVVGVGLSITVAVPTFRRYMERARALDVASKLKQISDGAAAYYEESDRLAKVTREEPSVKIAKRFPESTLVTPARRCCEFSTAGLCEGTDWDTPTWRALGFSIDAPHRFRFQFISTGQGSDARFTIRAHADLDCDGLESTFEKGGWVDGDLKVRHGNAIHAVNEYE